MRNNSIVLNTQLHTFDTYSTITPGPQVAHTWCLLSGGTDGQILLWRAESPPEASDQQLSGAAMLAQLVPHMRLTEAALYSSPHWVVGVAAPVQQTDAGVDQGAYVALAQQPLLQVRTEIVRLHLLPGSLVFL